MKASLRKPQKATPVFQNTQLLNEYYDFLGLPKDHRIGFANQPCVSSRCKQFQGEHMHIRVTTPIKAYDLRVPIWRRVNIVDHPKRRGTTQDVRIIKNIALDIDWRTNPEIALEVGLHLRQKLSDELTVHPDIPIILSGGGVHIIINIPDIEVDEDDAELWNYAVAVFVKEKIEPLFHYAKSIVETMTMFDLSAMKLEGYDIDRLLSGPGDFRPSTHEDDHESLKEGIIRGIYKNQPLTRRECKPVREYILNAYMRLQQVVLHNDSFTENITDEELAIYKKVFWANKHKGDIYAAVADTIDWYVQIKDEDEKIRYKENGEIDYSALFAKLVLYISFRCLSIRGAYHFRHLIHAKCRNKYGLNDELLVKEITRVVKKWQGPLITTQDEKIEYLKEKKKDIKEIRLQFKPKDDSDQVFFLKFFNKICEKELGEIVEKKVLIEKYNKYCTNQKRKPMTEQQITRELTKLGIKSIQRRLNYDRVRYYENIRLKFSI